MPNFEISGRDLPPDSNTFALESLEQIQVVDAWAERAVNHKKLLTDFLDMPDGKGEKYIYFSLIIGANIAINHLANRKTFLEHQILQWRKSKMNFMLTENT